MLKWLVLCRSFTTVYPLLNHTVQLRLVAKNERMHSSLTAGRVEVFNSGEWGTICSDGFDYTDARVLCEILTGSSSILDRGRVGVDGRECVTLTLVPPTIAITM